MKYGDVIAEKRQEQARKEQAKKDMLTLVHYFKKASVNTPSDFEETVKKLSENILNALKENKADGSITKEIRGLVTGFSSVAASLVKQQQEQLAVLVTTVEKLANSISTDRPIDVSPITDALKNFSISVPTPEVTVNQITPPSLDDYRAHDLREDGAIQYIGFVNPDGKWYIVENDSENNRLRYVFGSKGYSKAFSKAGSWQYKLLSEAMAHEV